MLFPGWCQSVIFISCCRQWLMTFGLLQWVRAQSWSVRARGEVAHSWLWSEVDSLPSPGGISRMDCSSSRRRKLEYGNKTLKRAGVSGSICIHDSTPSRSSWVHFRRTLSISIGFFHSPRRVSVHQFDWHPDCLDACPWEKWGLLQHCEVDNWISLMFLWPFLFATQSVMFLFLRLWHEGPQCSQQYLKSAMWAVWQLDWVQGANCS